MRSSDRPAAWPAFAAFAVAFVLVFVATSVLLLGVALLRAGGDVQRVPQEVESFATSALGVACAALASAAVLSTVAFVGARLGHGSAASALGLRRWRATATGMAAAIVGMIGLSVASGTATELLGLRGKDGTMEHIARALTTVRPWQLPLIAIAIAIAPAIAEETFFRGLLQRRLVARWGRWPGIPLAAAAFALIHLDPVQGLVAFVAGLYLGWIADRFDSIGPSIIAHATNNVLFVALSHWASTAASRRMELILVAGGCTALLGSIAFLARDFAKQSRAP